MLTFEAFSQQLEFNLWENNTKEKKKKIGCTTFVEHKL